MQRTTLFILGILGVLLFCNLFYIKEREGVEKPKEEKQKQKDAIAVLDEANEEIKILNDKKKEVADDKQEGEKVDAKEYLKKSNALNNLRQSRLQQNNFVHAQKLVNSKKAAPLMKGMRNISSNNKDVLFKLSFNNMDANGDGSIDKSEFKGIGKSALEAFSVREGLAGGDKNWKVTIDQGGDLVFNHKGKTVTKITKQGEIVSKKCKCGMWNLRDSRIGIPGRNDMNLHTDGWFRALNYGAPEVSAGRHKHGDYTKGGFAGKQLWYGGSIGGKLHRG